MLTYNYVQRSRPMQIAGQCTFVRSDQENITYWLMDTCLKYQEQCRLKYNSVKCTIQIHKQLSDKVKGNKMLMYSYFTNSGTMHFNI